MNIMKSISRISNSYIRFFTIYATMIVTLMVFVNNQAIAQEQDNMVPDELMVEIPQPEPMITDVNEQIAEPQTPEIMNEVNDQIVQPELSELNELDNAAPPNNPLANINDGEELFFDAEAIIQQETTPPEGSVRNNLTRVDPREQQGSSFVIVTQDAQRGSQQAKLISANRAMSLGRFEAAIEIFNSVLSKNSRDVSALMGKAIAHQRLGQDDLAIFAYESVLQNDSDNLEARINMQGIIGQKYPSVALRNLKDIRRDNPNHIGLLAQTAVIQANMKQYEDALKSLAVAASLEPRNPSHVFNMAVIADRSGTKTEAIKLYEQALEIDTIHGKGNAIPRDVIFERLASLR